MPDVAIAHPFPLRVKSFSFCSSQIAHTKPSSRLKSTARVIIVTWTKIGNIKGEKGDSVVGPQGPTGPKGDSIVGPAGKDGQSITGPQGPAGKDATIATGTTTTGAAGSQAAAVIVDGKLNLTLPRGDTGAAGKDGQSIVGPQGPAGANALSSIAAPTAISPLPAFGSAYQVTKTSNLSICVDVSYTASLVALEDVIELRVGSDATVATTGGVVVASWRAGLTGLAGIVGMVISSRDQLTAIVPGSMYWALRRTKGTASTVVSAVIQPLV